MNIRQYIAITSFLFGVFLALIGAYEAAAFNLAIAWFGHEIGEASL